MREQIQQNRAVELENGEYYLIVFVGAINFTLKRIDRDETGRMKKGGITMKLSALPGPIRKVYGELESLKIQNDLAHKFLSEKVTDLKAFASATVAEKEKILNEAGISQENRTNLYSYTPVVVNQNEIKASMSEAIMSLSRVVEKTKSAKSLFNEAISLFTYPKFILTEEHLSNLRKESLSGMEDVAFHKDGFINTYKIADIIKLAPGTEISL